MFLRKWVNFPVWVYRKRWNKLIRGKYLWPIWKALLPVHIILGIPDVPGGQGQILWREVGCSSLRTSGVCHSATWTTAKEHTHWRTPALRYLSPSERMSRHPLLPIWLHSKPCWSFLGHVVRATFYLQFFNMWASRLWVSIFVLPLPRPERCDLVSNRGSHLRLSQWAQHVCDYHLTF